MEEKLVVQKSFQRQHSRLAPLFGKRILNMGPAANAKTRDGYMSEEKITKSQVATSKLLWFYDYF